MAAPEAELRPGWVTAELRSELPGFGVECVTLDCTPSKSPREIRERLRAQANRINGASVVHMRQDEVPWAYRVLWRRVGIDPDVDRTPIEALMVERLRHGGLRSRGLPADALTIATLETGVPVLAFDLERVAGGIGLRPAEPGEALGERPLPSGQIVYCDQDRPLATLLGEVAPDAAASEGTREIALVALTAGNVARMRIEEAVWTAVDILRDAGSVTGVDQRGGGDR